MADLMNEVNVRVNFVGGKEAERGLNRLDKATERVASTSQSFASQSNTTTKSVKSQADANHIASRQTNAYGMAMQQTGYQVGDFIVQVQSGTNAFVAFGQQATQLVGILPMLADRFGLNVNRLIGISAGLGIVIPLATALGAAFMRAGGDSETFEDKVSNLDDALSALSNANDRASMSTSELRKEYGSASTELQSTLDLLKGIARSEAQDAIDNLSDAVSNLYRPRGSGERRTALANLFDVNIFLAFTDAQREARSEARSLTAEFVKQQTALSQSKGDLDAQISATQTMLNLARQLSVLNGKETEDERSLIKLLAERLLQMQELKVASEDVSNAHSNTVTHLMQIATIQKDVKAGVDNVLATRDAELKRLRDQTRINNLILKHGEDSKEVTEARLALEREVYKAKQIENDILGENLKQVMAAYDAYIDSKQAVEDMSDATANAASNASSLANEMSRAASEAIRFISNLGSGAGLASAQARVAGLRAELTARQGGAGDVEAAGARARAQAMSDPRTQLALQGPVGLVEKTRANVAREVEIARTNAIANQISRKISEIGRTETSGGGGGGTSSTNKTQEDYLANLKREAELKLRMAGRSEEEQRRLEIMNELKEKELLVNGKLTSQQSDYINSILQTEETLRQVEQAEKERQDLMQTVNDSIEQGLMSLIDGSASVQDAFTSMIRAILQEIAMQAIVKPISSGITDFLFPNANGNTFNAGRVVPFADGGVVSSPTTFPMAGRQTGLMGEAGPEAIMPLKRGKGGKLGVVAEGGGQQPVVINQSFNFAANGDDSVKKIIAQEAPKIANLTQKQILEQRPRGGTWKSTFG